MNKLTQARLKEVLNYDPETGLFTWLYKPSKNVNMGDIAGHVHSSGYVNIKINNEIYRAHRLAWLYVNGSWPVDQLDHINRVRNNNRLVNLREVTNQQNQFNRVKTKNNTSGYRGVSWHKRDKTWRAQIGVNGKKIQLGSFTDIIEASQMYERAKEMYHII